MMSSALLLMLTACGGGSESASNGEAESETLAEKVENAADAAAEKTKEMGDAASNVAAGAAEKVEEASNKAADSAKEMSDAVTQAADSAKAATGKAAASAAEKANTAADATKSVAQEAKTKAGAAVTGAAGAASALAQNAAAGASEAVNKAAEATADTADAVGKAVSGEATVHEVAMYSSNPENSREKNVFVPDLMVVKPGDTVRFVPTNPTHQSSSIDGMVPEGAEGWKGDINKAIEFVAGKPGVYGYKCVPHYAGGMVGMVIVQGEGMMDNVDSAKSTKHIGLAKRRFDDLWARAEAEYLNQ